MPIMPNCRRQCLHLPANTTGRDFVVGDIHGSMDEYLAMLDLIKFDKSVDRMISVGDLVDRGQDSVGCGELIYDNHFYSVLGNHEHMMIGALVAHDPSEAALWFSNGGSWRFDYDRTHLEDLAKAFDTLPYMIAVGEGESRFHVVHADLIKYVNTWQFVPVTDTDVDHWSFDEDDKINMIWSRRLHNSVPGTLSKYHAPTLSLTFCGHTPLTTPVQRGRQMYIDGGAVFGQYEQVVGKCSLIMAEPNAKVLHIYNTRDKTFDTLPFANVNVIT